MAMIKCVECGNDISDKATACPHCGAPASVQTFASFEEYKFTVEYTEAKGRQKSVIFCLDDKEMYTIQPGDIFECETTLGKHLIEIRRGENTIGKFQFRIHSGQDLVVLIVVDGSKALFRKIDNAGEQRDLPSARDILQEMNERELQKDKNKELAGLLFLITIFFLFGLFIYAIYTDSGFIERLIHSINDIIGHTHHIEITFQAAG